MVGRSAIVFPLALLALLAVLTLWIDHLVQPPEPKRDGSSRHDPDYKLTNFSTSKTDKDGNLRHRLAAVEMVHYPDDDSTQLVRPRFTQYSATKPFTQIQGQRGMVTSDGENVYFMDNVKVVRGATRQKGEMTVLTDYLHIIPDQELVMTDRPVSILQAPRTVVHATGMEYNKKLGILKLFKRVKVHYERPGLKLRPLSAPKKSAATTKKISGGKKPVKTAQQAKTGNTKTRVRRQYDKTATQP
jgi:lipopolysaccharide export system protein LptC